ncbi:mechanosensitive ion channel family protein [Gayadomonas joobiniege]|uniref:mechanosensitive ion channel family protein n=1 Tax=Gayadomonas joobiniege TaxID=1234606 RepID=UPI000377E2EA|nr:mechanosensitive ion channel family protein [Gayadomonas joobiniege]
MSSFLFSLLALVGFWFLKNTSRALVERIGQEKQIDEKRIHYVKMVITLALAVVTFMLISIVLGIDYSHLAIFFSSAFAVIGVAFFAQWSILSNVTASVMVYFFFPYRVGDTVTIVDGENSVSGKISEITLFHVILKNPSGRIATYPNSLVFQKAVMIEPLNPTQTDTIVTTEENNRDANR